jgi:hypothetical protein
MAGFADKEIAAALELLVVPFFVVTAGQVEIVRPSGTTEALVAVHTPGQFTGTVGMAGILLRDRLVDA